jgi:hypothetical protein
MCGEDVCQGFNGRVELFDSFLQNLFLFIAYVWMGGCFLRQFSQGSGEGNCFLAQRCFRAVMARPAQRGRSSTMLAVSSGG